jgi:hypothetical protein
MSEAGREQSIAAMERFVAELESRGASPWADRDGLRPWQEGTAGRDEGGEDSPS